MTEQEKQEKIAYYKSIEAQLEPLYHKYTFYYMIDHPNQEERQALEELRAEIDALKRLLPPPRPTFKEREPDRYDYLEIWELDHIDERGNKIYRYVRDKTVEEWKAEQRADYEKRLAEWEEKYGELNYEQ